MARPRHRARDPREVRAPRRGRAHDLLERADGRLRVAAVRRGDEGRRTSGSAVRRILGRRRRRFRARPDRARARRRRLLAVHRRRRRARAARGERASGSSRDPMLIAGNWKMYKGPAESAEFCLGLREQELEGVDVVICPPFVSLAVAVQLLAGTEIAVAAQNVHWEEEGPYTGEISPRMLRELGVYGTIVGHSERRQYFGETDEAVGNRVHGALEAGPFDRLRRRDRAGARAGGDGRRPPPAARRARA